jgi:hypothetical protein
MAKKLSTWNLFVKKIYAEGKAKNPNFAFKDALKEASKRKGEMKTGASSSESSVTKSTGTKKRGTKKRGTRKRKSKTSKKR